MEKDKFGLTSEDWAYIAGYMDADGCFTIASNPNRKTGNQHFCGTSTTSNTDSKIPKMLYETFGGSLYVETGKRNNKDFTRWRLTGQTLKPFLRSIIPFLRMKQERASLLLRFLDYQGKEYERIKNENGFGQRSYPPEVITCFKTLYQNMKELNRQGKSI